LTALLGGAPAETGAPFIPTFWTVRLDQGQ
jgi:hypothetical protein